VRSGRRHRVGRDRGGLGLSGTPAPPEVWESGGQAVGMAPGFPERACGQAGRHGAAFGDIPGKGFRPVLRFPSGRHRNRLRVAERVVDLKRVGPPGEGPLRRPVGPSSCAPRARSNSGFASGHAPRPRARIEALADTGRRRFPRTRSEGRSGRTVPPTGSGCPSRRASGAGSAGRSGAGRLSARRRPRCG
jgi:hypothetical protein